jgi:hypothetical protein
MDAIALIVSALAAGASAGAIEGLKGDVQAAARTAYSKVRTLAGRRVAGRPDSELALERHQDAPHDWGLVLARELTRAGAADDADLVASARALMEFLHGAGAGAHKYDVTVKDSRGVQVGDGNVQVNKF